MSQLDAKIENFYVFLQETRPATALVMHPELVRVTRYALLEDWEPAYSSVRKLRKMAMSLPSAQSMLLDEALRDLGYPQDVFDFA